MNVLAAQGASLLTVKALTVGLGAVVILFTVELIRRDLLRMSYALVWLTSGAVVMLVGLFPPLLGLLQRLTGMNYQTAMQFCIFGFLLLMLMQFSIIISRLSHRDKNLAQELALLREEVRRLSDKAGPAGGSAEATAAHS